MDVEKISNFSELEVDYSQVDFINDIWVVKNTSTIVIETTIYAPVVIFGLFANIMSIYILVKNPHIRTPANLLIGNMATADLLSLLIHPWIFLLYDFYQNYQLGSFGCQTEAGTESTLLLTSVMSMSVISYDRLTAIVLPHETRLTKRGAKIVITVTWFLSALISSPLFYYRKYKERQWKDFLEKFCIEKTIITNTYHIVLITVLIWLPLLIQVLCYIIIFTKLHKYEKVVLRKLNHNQVNYKKRAAKMMISVIVTFLICHLPYTVLIFYRRQLLLNVKLKKDNTVQNQVNGTYHSLWYSSKLLIYVNAALNPIIYGYTNEKLRKAYQATKLSKWLFPKRMEKPTVAKQKKETHNKTTETSLNKPNIFFIFKKKIPPLVESTATNQTLKI